MDGIQSTDVQAVVADPYVFTLDAAALDRLQAVMDENAVVLAPDTQINLIPQSDPSGTPTAEALSGTIAGLAELANDFADAFGANSPAVTSILEVIDELQVLLDSMLEGGGTPLAKSDFASDFRTYSVEFPGNPG